MNDLFIIFFLQKPFSWSSHFVCHARRIMAKNASSSKGLQLIISSHCLIPEWLFSIFFNLSWFPSTSPWPTQLSSRSPQFPQHSELPQPFQPSQISRSSRLFRFPQPSPLRALCASLPILFSLCLDLPLGRGPCVLFTCVLPTLGSSHLTTWFCFSCPICFFMFEPWWPTTSEILKRIGTEYFDKTWLGRNSSHHLKWLRGRKTVSFDLFQEKIAGEVREMLRSLRSQKQIKEKISGLIGGKRWRKGDLLAVRKTLLDYSLHCIPAHLTDNKKTQGKEAENRLKILLHPRAAKQDSDQGY